MPRSSTRRSLRPRELRRRVILPARMRTPAGWSDACILNLSSRGLMVHANFSVFKGGVVELWHGDHSITARVVWRQGAKAGLRAEDRVPVEDLLGLSQTPSVQSTAAAPGVERRMRPRSHDDSRIKARIFEFASIAIVAATLAVGFSSLVGSALAQPLTTVRAALRD